MAERNAPEPYQHVEIPNPTDLLAKRAVTAGTGRMAPTQHDATWTAGRTHARRASIIGWLGFAAVACRVAMYGIDDPSRLYVSMASAAIAATIIIAVIGWPKRQPTITASNGTLTIDDNWNNQHAIDLHAHDLLVLSTITTAPGGHVNLTPNLTPNIAITVAGGIEHDRWHLARGLVWRLATMYSLPKSGGYHQGTQVSRTAGYVLHAPGPEALVDAWTTEIGAPSGQGPAVEVTRTKSAIWPALLLIAAPVAAIGAANPPEGASINHVYALGLIFAILWAEELLLDWRDQRRRARR